MKSSLVVGIPKEIKPLEKRVGLTPGAVQTLTRSGIRVLIEQKAGVFSGFQDSDYKNAGAEIVPDAKTIYGKAGLIQKVKEPLAPEFPLLNGQVLFCFLHLASPENAKLREALLKSGCTAIGFETVEKEGRLPILAPMSRIAGGLAAAYGAYLQRKRPAPGDDITEDLGKVAGFYPDFKGKLSLAKTVIFGGGVVGESALVAALQMKGETAVVEMNGERRAYLKNFTPDVFSPQEIPEKILEQADVLIGAVHSRGQRAIQVLKEEAFSKISRAKKKIILDVSIDQGGNFPEAHSTSYHDPLYLDSFGNLRFAVPNIPSFCGRAASEALAQVTLPYTQALAADPEGAFSQFPELEKGINIRKGQMRI